MEYEYSCDPRDDNDDGDDYDRVASSKCFDIKKPGNPTVSRESETSSAGGQ